MECLGGQYQVSVSSLLADGTGGAKSSSHARFNIPDELDRRDYGRAELWWNPNPKASRFEVEISENEKVIESHIIEKPEFNVPFKVGKFSRRVRARLGDGTIGEWSKSEAFEVLGENPKVLAPATDAQIETPETTESRVKFEWLRSRGAQKYRLDVFNVDKDGKQLASSYSESDSETKAEPKLQVGKAYHWQITPIREDQTEIEKSVESGNFVLLGSQLTPPAIEVPASRYVNTLRWKPTDVNKNFDYVVERFDRKSKAWLKVDSKVSTTEQEILFALKNPGGRYKLSVRAVGEFRKPSNWETTTFQVQNGDRSPEASYSARLRESLEAPSGVYFLASYLISVLDYKGEDPQSDSSIATSALGGTGRLGIGYNPPKSDFGYLAIADLSGFRISGRNFTFAAAEGHVVWRRALESYALRSSAGLFYKELVEVRGELGRLEMADVKTVATAGPHIGFDLTKPLTPEYGIQLNARLYMSAMGVKTPNGKPSTSTFSYQLGVMASKKLRRFTTGYIGYAYRVDNAAYKSTTDDDSSSSITSLASPDSIQRLTIKGHYLNLMLEY
jgi:hypothetical protein